MAIKVIKGGNGTKGQTLEQLLAGVTATQAAITVSALALTALTDNSTGSAAAKFTIPEKAVAIAASGSNLAQKAATETALGKVKNALATLYTRANAVATGLGLETSTYVGGGTDGAGTVAALDKSVTGATTGAALVEYEANRLAINGNLTTLKGFVDRLANAVGIKDLADKAGQTGAHVAITGTVGTAAAPGVSKAKVDADLTAWANNVAILAAKLNAITSVSTKPQVIIVN